MENTKKRKKHYFLKFAVLLLIFCGTVLYAGFFPVTMKLLDDKVNVFLALCKTEKDFCVFSEFSDLSRKIINSAEYWFEIAEENLKGINSETKKVPAVIITCAAKFPSENGKITSYFGKREDPFSKKESFHSGIDIAAGKGSDITAAWPGTVWETGYDGIYGNYIIIEHAESFFTKYCHLSKIEVKEKALVSANEKIGEAGSTGRSTGSHLHFEVIVDGRKIDPMEYFEL